MPNFQLTKSLKLFTQLAIKLCSLHLQDLTCLLDDTKTDAE